MGSGVFVGELEEMAGQLTSFTIIVMVKPKLSRLSKHLGLTSYTYLVDLQLNHGIQQVRLPDLNIDKFKKR